MSEWNVVGLQRKKSLANSLQTKKSPAKNIQKKISETIREVVPPRISHSASLPVQCIQKFGAGTNKKRVFSIPNITKLDRETEELRHNKIPLDLGKLIQQARQSKGLSQKDIATKIFEKQQIIADYEAGRAIPNNIILAKLEKVIGVRLLGKDRGQPIVITGNKKTYF